MPAPLTAEPVLNVCVPPLLVKVPALLNCVSAPPKLFKKLPSKFVSKLAPAWLLKMGPEPVLNCPPVHVAAPALFSVRPPVSVLVPPLSTIPPLAWVTPTPVIVPLLQLVSPEIVTKEVPPKLPEVIPSVLALTPPLLLKVPMPPEKTRAPEVIATVSYTHLTL